MFVKDWRKTMQFWPRLEVCQNQIRYGFPTARGHPNPKPATLLAIIARFSDNS